MVAAGRVSCAGRTCPLPHGWRSSRSSPRWPIERQHRPNWHARFANRYTITRDGNGSVLGYTCQVWPQNYVPFWLHPLMRPLTRVMVPRAIRKNMENLAALAEAAGRAQPDGENAM